MNFEEVLQEIRQGVHCLALRIICFLSLFPSLLVKDGAVPSVLKGEVQSDSSMQRWVYM